MNTTSSPASGVGTTAAFHLWYLAAGAVGLVVVVAAVALVVAVTLRSRRRARP